MSTPSLLGGAAGVGERADVEADDHRVGGGGQHHVGLVDPARLGVDHVDRDLLLRQLRDLVLERLQGAGDVGLEHDVELLELALAGLLEDLLEGDLAGLAAGELLGLQPGLALLGDGRACALVRPRPGRARRPRRRRRSRVPRRECPGWPPRRRSPLSSSIARTLPQTGPATTASPTRRVPRWTSTPVTGPRPGSSSDSTTVPEAGAFGLAPSSSSSVTSRIISSRLSRPSLVFAETSA